MEQQPHPALNVNCDPISFKLYLDTKQPQWLIDKLQAIISEQCKNTGITSEFIANAPFNIHVSNSTEALQASESEMFEGKKVDDLLRQLQEALHSSVNIIFDGKRYRVLLNEYEPSKDSTEEATTDTLVASDETSEMKRPQKQSGSRPLTEAERNKMNQRTTSDNSGAAADDMLKKHFRRP